MPEPGAAAFLVLEPRAVSSALVTAKLCKGHVWLGANAITEAEFQSLIAQGHLITRFAHELTAADESGIQDAVETMKEHHPNVVIWVQRA